MFWTEYPRDVVAVAGPDAATYLHSQVSNDLRPLQVGALLAGDQELATALSQYGDPLGEAFQLRDDVLGVFGLETRTGKPVGDDLREGKPTLPLLGAMASGTAEERELIRHAIEHGEVERLREIVAIVHRTGALEVTRQAALREAEAARQSIAALPPSHAQKILLEFPARSVDRSF